MTKKHALIMAACCLVPIAGIVLVSVFDIPLKSVFYFALILFCPLSHILIMKYMGQGEDHQHGNTVEHAHHQVASQISGTGKPSD
jgi:hypothetical protein